MAEHVPTTRRSDLHPAASTGRRSLLSAAPAVMVLAGAGIGAELVAAQDRGEIARAGGDQRSINARASGNGPATLPDIGIPPDAELIAHCAQLDALEHEFLATDFNALPNTPEGDHAEAEQDRIADAQAPIVDAICARPAQTPAGAVAVAHSLALVDADLFRRGGPDGYPNDRLIAALVRGLTGRAAA